MAYTTIRYDEGNKENLGYTAVELHYGYASRINLYYLLNNVLK